MSVTGTPKWSFRLAQADSSRLVWAFVISFALHLTIFGTYELGRKFDWWNPANWPAWLQPVHKLAELLKKQPVQPPQPQDTPLMFLDVSPAQATAEAPKDAKFYSDKNALAANPESDKDTDTPKIDGTQTQVVRTEDVPRHTFSPLQPAPPPQPVQPKDEQNQEEEKPKPAQAPGELAMAKPEPIPHKDEGPAERTRPRTIREALARLQPDQQRLVGQKMKQEGGSRRHIDISSFDTKASPFGSYDGALIYAVEQRWFALLDEQGYASDARGRVVVQFQLHYDGSVTDLTVSENTAGEIWGLKCLKAVRDPSPFGNWPNEMRRLAGDTRFIQFTFYYN
jgi:outer membrane biosynthesis protein TonB